MTSSFVPVVLMLSILSGRYWATAGNASHSLRRKLLSNKTFHTSHLYYQLYYRTNGDSHLEMHGIWCTLWLAYTFCLLALLHLFQCRVPLTLKSTEFIPSAI